MKIRAIIYIIIAKVCSAVIIMTQCWTSTQGFKMNPNDTALTVMEGEYQEIDCYEKLNGGKADLRWTGPPGASYTVTNKNTPNTDGSSTFHHILMIYSFSSQDTGIYTCTLHGRIAHPQQIQIELHLQKRCASGKYGKNCQYECSNFCKISESAHQVSPCDLIVGTCLFGCETGYAGSNCLTVCDHGKYGEGCNSSCSEFCKASKNASTSLCDHVTGTCLFGCRSGYNSANCTTALGDDSGHNLQTGLGVGFGLVSVGFLILIAVYSYRRCQRRQGLPRDDQTTGVKEPMYHKNDV